MNHLRIGTESWLIVNPGWPEIVEGFGNHILAMRTYHEQACSGKKRPTAKTCGSSPATGTTLKHSRLEPHFIGRRGHCEFTERFDASDHPILPQNKQVVEARGLELLISGLQDFDVCPGLAG